MFSFSRQEQKVVFTRTVDFEESEYSVPGLEFVTALNQAQLVENRLNFLISEDFPNLGGRFRYGDPYQKERDNYNSRYFYLTALIKFIETIELANPRGGQLDTVPAVDRDLVAKVPGPGDLDIFTVYSGEAFNSSEKTVKTRITPKEYGDAKEESFLEEFKETDVYHSVFKKHGLEIFPVEGHGILTNYLGFDIDIHSEPDFGVVDLETGLVVGFIEYKARMATPLIYDNVFNVDVMQTALYSQFQGQTADNHRPRVWTIQNYSESKFIVSEYSYNNVTDVLDYIDSVYHKLVHDVYYQNVSRWKHLYSVHGPESPQFWYTRNAMIRFITRDMEARSAYKHGDGNGRNSQRRNLLEDDDERYYTHLPRESTSREPAPPKLSVEELHRIYEYRNDGIIVNRKTGEQVIHPIPHVVPNGYHLHQDGSVISQDADNMREAAYRRKSPYPNQGLARRFGRFIYTQRGRVEIPQPGPLDVDFFNYWYEKSEKFIPTSA